jgi:hypothetical protein
VEEHEHQEPEPTLFPGEGGSGPLRRLLAAFGVLVAGAAFFATYYWWTRQGRRSGEADEDGEPPRAAPGGHDGHGPSERARHNGGGLHLPRRLHVFVPARHDEGAGGPER